MRHAGCHATLPLYISSGRTFLWRFRLLTSCIVNDRAQMKQMVEVKFTETWAMRKKVTIQALNKDAANAKPLNHQND